MPAEEQTKPLFIGSEIYRGSSYGDWHPLRVPRVSTVMDLSRALGWLPRSQYIPSPRAKPAALEMWHDADYLAVLQRAERDGKVTAEERDRYNIGTTSNPIFPEMFRRPATGAGAVLLAGELLKSPSMIYAPGGGTHHGLRDRANGFCYLNDPVLAILGLRRTGLNRVAYIDIDAHHPDGVESAFGQDEDVLMISTHEENRWPFKGLIEDRGKGTLFNLPLMRGTNDDEMALILDQLILNRIQSFKPDAVVLQCGADAVLEDPLSRLALSNNAHWQVVSALMDISDRLLVLGGGGYNPWSVGRLWTGVWATLRGLDIPTRLPPEGEAVLRALEWRDHRMGRAPEEHWFTTLRDAPRNGAIRPELRSRLAQLSQ